MSKPPMDDDEVGFEFDGGWQSIAAVGFLLFAVLAGMALVIWAAK